MARRRSVLTALALGFAGAVATLLSPSSFAQTSAAPPSGVYEADPGHRYLGLSYSHMGFSQTFLRFEDFSVTLNLDAAKPANSSVRAVITTSSLRSGFAAFDGHLASEGFFNAAAFPTAVFHSTKVELTSPTTARVTGDLTIKDQTHPVTLDVTLNRAAENPMTRRQTLGFRATGRLLRSQWGLGVYAPNVGDEVDIIIDAELPAAAPAGN